MTELNTGTDKLLAEFAALLPCCRLTDPNLEMLSAAKSTTALTALLKSPNVMTSGC